MRHENILNLNVKFACSLEELKFWINFIITEPTLLQSLKYLTPWNLTQKSVVSNLDKFCSFFGIWSFCYYVCFFMITSANRRIRILSQMNPVHSSTSLFVWACVSIVFLSMQKSSHFTVLCCWPKKPDWYRERGAVCLFIWQSVVM